MGQYQADVTQLTDCDSGARPTSQIRFIAIHTYECPRSDDVEGRARWQHTSRTGSYHVLFGMRRSLRANDDNYISWSAMYRGNLWGVHFCFLGYARETRDVWLANMPQLEKAAVAAAVTALEYQIPRRWLTPAELRAGGKGFCTHGDISAAWHESDHTDPGAGFPKDVFMRLVEEHVTRITNPTPVAPAPVENKEDTLTDLDKRRIELVLDQLVGSQKHKNGEPTFEGWSIADVTRVFDEREGDTATMMQVACLNHRELQRIEEGLTKLSNAVVRLCDALAAPKPEPGVPGEETVIEGEVA